MPQNVAFQLDYTVASNWNTLTSPTTIASNFGQSLSTQPLGSVVPEPCVAWMMGMTLLALRRRRVR
jgi:hypothetical protein